jgi:hypothetical protein
LEIKKIADKDLALVITTWLDLGSGSTPMGTRWRVHLARDKAAEIGKSGEAGDIRLRFEGEPGLWQDTLSCQNAPYLIAKRFMGARDRWENRTWILQAGKRLPSYHSDRIFFPALFLAALPYIILAAWDISSRAK